MNSIENKNRLHVVDALRGLAIVSIMLLHNLEHFDVYFLPKNLPEWMVNLDGIIWKSLFFVFAGKSYAIFALLFGLTFYIQSKNQEDKGNDFRLTFAWRLLLLFLFGIVNSAFFQGDILTIYAAIGIFLIPFTKLNNTLVFGIALFFLIQPLELYHLYKAFQTPDAIIGDPESWAYFGKMNEYIKEPSFIDTIIGNLTNGKKAVLYWSAESGRYFHIIALFMLGMLAGRKKLFVVNSENKKFWIKTLIIATLAFIPLFYFQKNIDSYITSDIIKRSVATIETSYTNIAFMLILVAGFVLLFQTKVFNKILAIFSSMGRMSLTNYIIQSILGSTLYYGFGFGLYQYTGATYSFLIGTILAIAMGIFSTWWLKNHKRGPLEELWHKATWVFSK